MPELPEIETIVRYLQQQLVGERVLRYQQLRDNLRYKLDPDIPQKVQGHFIDSVFRKAKYINIALSNTFVLSYHLGMSGKLTLQNQNYNLQKHDHLILELISKRQLVLNDPRRFGMLHICLKEQLLDQPHLNPVGLEPLESQFDSCYLADKLKNRKNSIKTAIMSHELVVGIGNIYASESLFLAKIHPSKPCYLLSKHEITTLVLCIKHVLSHAIECGGTSIKDFIGGNGQRGSFQQQIMVYNRNKEQCKCCSTQITKIKQAGRATFFCPNCQRI